MRYHRWKIAVTTADKYYVGIAENREITILIHLIVIPLPDSPILDAASKGCESICLLSSFSCLSMGNDYEEGMFTLSASLIYVIGAEDDIRLWQSFT